MSLDVVGGDAVGLAVKTAELARERDPLAAGGGSGGGALALVVVGSKSGWRMCERWDERVRGVLPLATLVPDELGRRVDDGEGNRSSALSSMERSVARLDAVGLCTTALVLWP